MVHMFFEISSERKMGVDVCALENVSASYVF